MRQRGLATATTLSYLICKWGGIIEPYTSGQEYFDSSVDGQNTEIENSDPVAHYTSMNSLLLWYEAFEAPESDQWCEQSETGFLLTVPSQTASPDLHIWEVDKGGWHSK